MSCFAESVSTAENSKATSWIVSAPGLALQEMLPETVLLTLIASNMNAAFQTAADKLDTLMIWKR